MPDGQQRNPRESGDSDGDDDRPGGPEPAATTSDPHPGPLPDLAPGLAPDDGDAARRHRRAQFLRELNEAKALRERVKPRRARAARMRQQMRMRTFRW